MIRLNHANGSLESPVDDNSDICVLIARMLIKVPERKSIKNITVNKMAYDILCHQAKRDKNVLTGWPGKITSFVGIPIEVVEA